LDRRVKRSLMKFLKFVVDYENQTEIWEPHAGSPLPEFLSSQFQLPPDVQSILAALTLSLDPPEVTTVGCSLPRIARHLTSIGVFGPGFGAVVPKWGGGAEIAQVACRAGAVGGGVYVLGTGVKSATSSSNGVGDATLSSVEVVLSNGEIVKTRHFARGTDYGGQPTNATVVSKTIGVVSSPLTSLFASNVEGSPTAAVSIVVFPPKSLERTQVAPIYVMVHSSETGECPAGQCVLYATTLRSDSSKALLQTAISAFLKVSENGEGKLLYSLYYEQSQVSSSSRQSTNSSDSSLDLAFNEDMLRAVEEDWKLVKADAPDEGLAPFMQFDERPGMNDDDEDGNGDDNGY